MSDLRDKIIEKSIEFRDASFSMQRLSAFPNDSAGRKALLDSPKNLERMKAITIATKELFELLDELDSLEGRGIKR